jgi:hypothetical protein
MEQELQRKPSFDKETKYETKHLKVERRFGVSKRGEDYDFQQIQLISTRWVKGQEIVQRFDLSQEHEKELIDVFKKKGLIKG